MITVSQEKWDRLRSIVNKWNQRIEAQAPLIRKELESNVGFLIYVVRTYPAMKPYLKGFHLTLHGWRPDRNEEGWKIHVTRDKTLDAGGTIKDVLEPVSNITVEEPQFVTAVPRLLYDVRALESLSEGTTPPLRIVRPTKVRAVR